MRMATIIEPVAATNWTLVDQTSSKTTFTGHELPVGQRIWVQVRAVNAAGFGPWSDPATIVVG
jgi:hypothetical protein